MEYVYVYEYTVYKYVRPPAGLLYSPDLKYPNIRDGSDEDTSAQGTSGHIGWERINIAPMICTAMQ
jgi:hypothetical protein